MKPIIVSSVNNKDTIPNPLYKLPNISLKYKANVSPKKSTNTNIIKVNKALAMNLALFQQITLHIQTYSTLFAFQDTSTLHFLSVPF